MCENPHIICQKYAILVYRVLLNNTPKALHKQNGKMAISVHQQWADWQNANSISCIANHLPQEIPCMGAATDFEH